VSVIPVTVESINRKIIVQTGHRKREYLISKINTSMSQMVEHHPIKWRKPWFKPQHQQKKILKRRKVMEHIKLTLNLGRDYLLGMKTMSKDT
jgi:hypothetical protein